MNQLSLRAEERGQIVKAAGDFFQQLDSVFRALYPLPPESETYLVTSINPEAGWHAVPADAREVQAAIRGPGRLLGAVLAERGLRWITSPSRARASGTPPELDRRLRTVVDFVRY